MRGIVTTANWRDDLIDHEILPKLVQGELVADPIPSPLVLPLPLLPMLSPSLFRLRKAIQSLSSPSFLRREERRRMPKLRHTPRI